MRLYEYVGPRRIAERVAGSPKGAAIRSPADASAWLSGRGVVAGRLVVTYVIDEAGVLRVADRHSEHVACAGGGRVRCAGELTLVLSAAGVEVSEVSNQSTGYCPEPTAWPAVAEAVAAAGLAGPEGFERECVFRRCVGCGIVNVVKGEWECAACGAALEGPDGGL